MIPRLTDAELDAVLAEHGKGATKVCWHEDHEVMPAWPCETVRLAKMAKDLLAVRDAARKEKIACPKCKCSSEITDGLGGGIDGDVRCLNCGHMWTDGISRALARYEEGGPK